MRAVFAEVIAGFTICVAIFCCVRLIGDQKKNLNSHGNMAKRLGETKANINTFIYLRSILIYVLCFSITWLFIERFLVSWPIPTKIIIQILATIGILAIARISLLWSSLPTKTSEVLNKIADIKPTNKITALTNWRLKEIFVRNHLTQIALLISILFSLFTAILIAKSTPEVAFIFSGFVAGYFSALCIAFQLQEDLKYAWVERFMGVSHSEFISAYTRTSLVTGFSAACLPTLTFLSIHILTNTLDINNISTALKLYVMISLPSYITPMLMFQIDGRKAAIQAINIGLIGLFLITAIYAHWLGVIALIIFRYYAITYQDGRFYRA